MKVYQTCGSFNTSTEEVAAKVMLPVLKHGGSYAFDSEFYNLSVEVGSTTHYIVLGVLRVTDESVSDLCNYKTDEIMLDTRTNSSFCYTDVENPLNVSIDLGNMTSNDELHLLCLHKDDFNIASGGEDILEDIYAKIPTYISSKNYVSMSHPNKGDGGILQANGCQF